MVGAIPAIPAIPADSNPVDRGKTHGPALPLALAFIGNNNIFEQRLHNFVYYTTQ